MSYPAAIYERRSPVEFGLSCPHCKEPQVVYVRGKDKAMPDVQTCFDCEKQYIIPVGVSRGS